MFFLFGFRLFATLTKTKSVFPSAIVVALSVARQQPEIRASLEVKAPTAVLRSLQASKREVGRGCVDYKNPFARLISKTQPSPIFAQKKQRGGKTKPSPLSIFAFSETTKAKRKWVAFSSAIWRGGCTAARRAGPTSRKSTNSSPRFALPLLHVVVLSLSDARRSYAWNIG